CPGPGSGAGTSRSSSTSGPPAAVMIRARMGSNVRRWSPSGNRAHSTEEEEADGRGHEDAEEHQNVQNRHAAGEARGPGQAAARIGAVLVTSAAPGLHGADGTVVQTARRAMKW